MAMFAKPPKTQCIKCIFCKEWKIGKRGQKAAELTINLFPRETEWYKTLFGCLKQSKHEIKEKIGDKNWARQNCLNASSYEFVSESI